MHEIEAEFFQTLNELVLRITMVFYEENNDMNSSAVIHFWLPSVEIQCQTVTRCFQSWSPWFPLRSPETRRSTQKIPTTRSQYSRAVVHCRVATRRSWSCGSSIPLQLARTDNAREVRWSWRRNWSGPGQRKARQRGGRR